MEKYHQFNLLTFYYLNIKFIIYGNILKIEKFHENFTFGTHRENHVVNKWIFYQIKFKMDNSLLLFFIK